MNAGYSGFHACKNHIDYQGNTEGKERSLRIAQCVDLRIQMRLQFLKNLFDIPSVAVQLGNYFGICRSFRQIAYNEDIGVFVPSRFFQGNSYPPEFMLISGFVVDLDVLLKYLPGFSSTYEFFIG